MCHALRCRHACRFTEFLECYTSDKLDMLKHECKMIREELHISKLDTQAPFAYVCCMS